MDNVLENKRLVGIYQLLSELTIKDLDEVMGAIIGLKKRKLPTVLSETETELLQKINAGVPVVLQKRYDFLVKKSHKEALKVAEQEELLILTSYMEQHDVQRLEYLLLLAQLRNQTLEEVLVSLEIKPRLNVA